VVWFELQDNESHHLCSLFLYTVFIFDWSLRTEYGALTSEGLATLLHGNQRAFSGQRQGCKTPGELAVNKSVKCDFSLQCFDTVGWATGTACDM